MAYTPKDWRDLPDHSTPITAAALEDMESRLAAYAETLPGPKGDKGDTGEAGPGTFNITVGAGAMGGIYPVTDFGAIGDDTADDTTAVQDAIDTAKSGGGIVYFPPGTYKITSALDGHLEAVNPKTWRMTGPGGMGQITDTTPTLHWTGGAGSGSMLECYSVAGFELDHLRFAYDDAAYDGDLIDIDGDPLNSDATNWRVHHCSSYASIDLTARSIIRVSGAIIGAIHDNSFHGAENAIRLGDPGDPTPGSDYCVGIYIERNTFNNSTDAHILIGTGDAEDIVVSNNVFEAGASTPALRCAHVSDGDAGTANVYTLVFDGNWCGDTGAATIWLKSLVAGMVTVRGNYFADCQTGGAAISLHNTNMTLSLIGNTFTGGSVVKDATAGAVAASQLTMIGNAFAAIHYLFGAAGADRSENLVMLNNTPGYASGLAAKSADNTPNDYFPPRLAMGYGAVDQANIPANGPDVGFANDWEGLIFAVSNSGALEEYLGGAAIYTRPGANSRAQYLTLQASRDHDDDEVQIVAGTTPAQVVRVSAAKLGFYGTAPQAKPEITGSAGGNAALQDLLASLEVMGLITDSST